MAKVYVETRSKDRWWCALTFFPERIASDTGAGPRYCRADVGESVVSSDNFPADAAGNGRVRGMKLGVRRRADRQDPCAARYRMSRYCRITVVEGCRDAHLRMRRRNLSVGFRADMSAAESVCRHFSHICPGRTAVADSSGEQQGADSSAAEEWSGAD